jgi:hypothetical protein
MAAAEPAATKPHIDAAQHFAADGFAGAAVFVGISVKRF